VQVDAYRVEGKVTNIPERSVDVPDRARAMPGDVNDFNDPVAENTANKSTLG
jgi:hypothetical protein